jgi:hypothetical protein
MDHEVIVEQLLDRCKGFIEQILQASDLHRVATVSSASNRVVPKTNPWVNVKPCANIMVPPVGFGLGPCYDRPHDQKSWRRAR